MVKMKLTIDYHHKKIIDREIETVVFNFIALCIKRDNVKKNVIIMNLCCMICYFKFVIQCLINDNLMNPLIRNILHVIIVRIIFKQNSFHREHTFFLRRNFFS